MTSIPVHPVRRLTLWLEGFASKPYAAVALFVSAFLEGSIFPLPVDVLLIALGITRPRRSVFYSLLAVAGSCTGAVLGYYLGNAVYDAVGSHLIAVSGAGAHFEDLLKQYRANAWLVLFLAGFTSVPFMVFTMAAGFNSSVDLMTLLFGALCGRLIRFVPIGIALYYFGSKVKDYVTRYLRRILLVTGVALILFLVYVWIR